VLVLPAPDEVRPGRQRVDEPEQAADMSNAGAPGMPSSAPMKQAVLGNTISGVMVATTISLDVLGVRPAASIALRAAVAPRVAVVSPLAAIRRSLIPVRWVIHSSFVSTILARSSLVRRRSGTQLPVPVMFAPKSCILDFGLVIWIAGADQ
jgi:hypothetical protein